MNRTIIDCHVHIHHGARGIEAMAAQQNRWNHTSCAAMSLEGKGPGYQDQNAICLAFKRNYPQMYAFCGLNHAMGDFSTQAKALWLAGCDGFKMIEGKPTVWKRWGIRLDAPVYQEFYATCQELKAPILFHVADPEDFWHLDRISQECFDLGWYYDNSFPCKEDLIQQALSVLEKFPDLTFIFAHFFFQSENLSRLSQMLDQYPNMYVDVTPGAELYPNFCQNPRKTQDFFAKYRERILYGTDSKEAMSEEETIYENKLIEMVEQYYTTENENSMWDLKFHGVPLDGKTLDAMFSKNFKRLVEHRSIDTFAAQQWFKRVLNDSKINLSDYERETITQLWS